VLISSTRAPGRPIIENCVRCFFPLHRARLRRQRSEARPCSGLHKRSHSGSADIQESRAWPIRAASPAHTTRLGAARFVSSYPHLQAGIAANSSYAGALRRGHHRERAGVTHEQRVAVRPSLCDFSRCDRAACARTVFDNHGPAELRRQDLRGQTGRTNARPSAPQVRPNNQERPGGVGTPGHILI
jgi:hypothetical protein